MIGSNAVAENMDEEESILGIFLCRGPQPGGYFLEQDLIVLHMFEHFDRQNTVKAEEEDKRDAGAL